MIALLVSLAPLAAAHEEDVIAANGAFIPGPVVPASFEDEDGGCVIEIDDAPFDLTGTLAGSATVDIEVVQEAPCDVPFAPATFEGHGTFEGMVNGASGTFGFELEGAVDALGTIEFRLEIEEGTGALAGLDGELTFEGTFPVGPITYSGQLVFDD